MKKVMFLLLVLTLCILPKTYAADVVAVNNKICPISHEEVGKDGMAPHKVIYNGKSYNLCCAMCEKDFKKDPAKYAKMLDEQAAEAKKM